MSTPRHMRRLAAGGILVMLLALGANALGNLSVRPPDILTLRVTTVSRGEAHEAEDGDLLSQGVDEVFIHGAAAFECHLIVVALPQGGSPYRLLPAGTSDSGDVVGPGPFRLPGGKAFTTRHDQVRIVAACGGPDLRFDLVADAASRARYKNGITGATTLDGLPPGTLQASRLFRE